MYRILECRYLYTRVHWNIFGSDGYGLLLVYGSCFIFEELSNKDNVKDNTIFMPHESFGSNLPKQPTTHCSRLPGLQNGWFWVKDEEESKLDWIEREMAVAVWRIWRSLEIGVWRNIGEGSVEEEDAHNISQINNNARNAAGSTQL